MLKEIVIRKEVDFAYAKCRVYVRYWEDSTLNGQNDNAENPNMPCVETVKNYKGEDCLAWCPVINLDKGQIENWVKGNTAELHFKSVDMNEVDLIDRDGELVRAYSGYVPVLLDPYDVGEGDYVIMCIDEDGYIEDFNDDINDILTEDF